MELKLTSYTDVVLIVSPLIVPYGIETKVTLRILFNLLPLIVPYGIETQYSILF